MKGCDGFSLKMFWSFEVIYVRWTATVRVWWSPVAIPKNHDSRPSYIRACAVVRRWWSNDVISNVPSCATAVIIVCFQAVCILLTGVQQRHLRIWNVWVHDACHRGRSKGGPGVAVATPFERLPTPVAIPFRFLDLIILYWNLKC